MNRNYYLVKYNEKSIWTGLSYSEKLDWSRDFINEHFSKFHHYQLSMNRGIYEKLIEKRLSKVAVLAILENQLLNK